MVEVKTTIFRTVVGAGLCNMIAKYGAQSTLQQMQGTVISSGTLTIFIVIGTGYFIAFLQGSVLDFNVMERLAVRRFLDIGHIRFESLSLQDSGIRTLAAGFRIEAGSGKDHITGIGEFPDAYAILEETDHLAGSYPVGITSEFRFFFKIHQVGTLTMHGLLIAAGILGTLYLCRHLTVKAFHIDPVAGIFRDLGSQLFREAIGVIEAEDHFTRENLLCLMGFQLFIEQVFTIGKCTMEAFLLLLDEP